MQSVKVKPIPIRVVRNTGPNSINHMWVKLVDTRTGKVHIGQPQYIKRIAREKYNAILEL